MWLRYRAFFSPATNKHFRGRDRRSSERFSQFAMIHRSRTVNCAILLSTLMNALMNISWVISLGTFSLVHWSKMPILLTLKPAISSDLLSRKLKRLYYLGKNMFLVWLAMRLSASLIALNPWHLDRVFCHTTRQGSITTSPAALNALMSRDATAKPCAAAIAAI